MLSRQVNLETIHDHDVLAERWGTVGELRSELAGGAPVERQTTLADWLTRSASRPPRPRGGSAARCRAAAGRCSGGAGRRRRRAATAAKVTTGQRSPSDDAGERQRDRRDERGERRVAEERERHDEDPEAERAPRAGASARVDAASGRDHLAALREPEPDRPGMAEHRRRAGEHPDPLAAELHARRARARSPSRRRAARRGCRATSRSCARRSTPRCCRFPACGCPRRRHEPRHDDAERDRPDQVPRGDDEGVSARAGLRLRRRPSAAPTSRALAGMPYAATQPFTTSQSRLAKNASM